MNDDRAVFLEKTYGPKHVRDLAGAAARASGSYDTERLTGEPDDGFLDGFGESAFRAGFWQGWLSSQGSIPSPTDPTDGAGRIAAERERQKSLGWSLAHDKEHVDNAMANAAWCYLTTVVTGLGMKEHPPTRWPMTWEWKPSQDAIRNLEKAGALIAADIDRRVAARAVSVPVEASTAPPNLIVEFIVPHYFASLFADQYPDEHGGLGGIVYFRNEEDREETATGDITVRQNSIGEWLIEVRNGDDNHVVIGTHIENVLRIVVL